MVEWLSRVQSGWLRRSIQDFGSSAPVPWISPLDARHSVATVARAATSRTGGRVDRRRSRRVACGVHERSAPRTGTARAPRPASPRSRSSRSRLGLWLRARPPRTDAEARAPPRRAAPRALGRQRRRRDARHAARRPPRLLRLRGDRDPEHRRRRPRGRRLRAGDGHGADDAALARVDPHRPHPAAPRRPRQRRLLPRAREDDARRADEGRGLRDRRLRRRVGPRPSLGPLAGLRHLLRPLRPLEVQGREPRHRAEEGRRGDGRRPRVARGRRGSGSSSRGSTSTTRTRPTSRRSPSSRATRASRTSARSPTPTTSSAGSSSWLKASGKWDEHGARAPRRPRREPRRARRAHAHVLRLRRHRPRAAHRAHAVGRPRAQRAPRSRPWT